MKEDNRRWSWGFWMVLAGGAWLGAGLGAADTAAAATTLKSGLLRSVTSNGTHCAVVNIGTNDITVLVSILDAETGDVLCEGEDDVPAGTAFGRQCITDVDTYCVVTGTFSAAKVRAKFATRDGDNSDAAVLELK